MLLANNQKQNQEFMSEFDYSLVENPIYREIESVENNGTNVPELDTGAIIKVTNGEYIPNYQYFTAAPTHGTNSNGSCGAVAAQLLLSYHNYYSDRRIIENKYLNGSISNPEDNPNYCTDPTSMTSETLGTRGRSESGSDDPNSYFAYLVDEIPLSASIFQVRQGLINVLSERNANLNNDIVYSAVEHLGPIFGAMAVDSKGIINCIEDGRPVIVLMQERLGGADHYVVAYGYSSYTYPGTTESYDGYITHFGWSDYYINVWVNSSWCCGYVDLEIDHTHNCGYEGKIPNTNRTEYKCRVCGYRTDVEPDHIYLHVQIVSKSGSTWDIKIENTTNRSLKIYYNKKCVILAMRKTGQD